LSDLEFLDVLLITPKRLLCFS